MSCYRTARFGFTLTVIIMLSISLVACSKKKEDLVCPPPPTNSVLVVYDDSGIQENSDIWTWSGADWGGPGGTFDAQYAGETPCEGTKCFMTISGPDWSGHTNYAGWGVFVVKPSDHVIDLSPYRYLKFCVKSPHDLKVEIQQDGRSGKKFSVLISSYGWDGNNTWQVITIPASAFQGAAMDRIFGVFMITVEHGGMTFFVDHVRWMKEATAVQVSGRRILIDGDPFFIKGVGYSPTPIGRDPTVPPYPPLTYDIFSEASIRQRDFPLLRSMGCNTIRTWGKVTSHAFLADAARYGVYVIMGFWVNAADFGDQAVRNALLNEFKSYVREFKDEPAVLMWSIGNEQNYDWMHEGGVGNWYSLVDEMARAAHQIEGCRFHPVTTPNGEILNIGNPNIGTDDASLRHLDVWSANIYRGCSFFSLFWEYEGKSAKPFWISEYGKPALTGNGGVVDEDRQAECIANLWNEISSNSAICSGGTIMEYCDEWWKAGNPGEHDLNLEEWWGIMSAASDSLGGANMLIPRNIYHELKRRWSS